MQNLIPAKLYYFWETRLFVRKMENLAKLQQKKKKK